MAVLYRWNGSAWDTVGGQSGSPVQACKMYRTSAQTIASSGTYTSISFQAEEYDYGGFWVVGSPTRLTVPAGQGGLYIVGYDAQAGQAFSDQKLFQAQLLKNGVFLQGSFVNESMSGANHWPAFGCITDVVLAVGDYVEMQVWQDQGTNIPVFGTAWIRRVESTS